METLQLIAYLTYIPIVAFVTIWVGHDLHKNGRVYIQEAFEEGSNIVDPINNMLLVGYYFLNIGLALIKIRGWPQMEHSYQVAESVASHTAFMLILLAGIHLFNLCVLAILNRQRQKIKN